MRLSDFDFDLPHELVAQHPAERRDRARLLVHEVPTGRTEHRRVRELAEELAPGDLLVVNDTRVVPSRLFARRASGGRVEVLLLEPIGGGAAGERGWWALCRPSRRLMPGEWLALEGGVGRVRLGERAPAQEGSAERVGKAWRVELHGAEQGSVALDERGALALLETVGHVPLPPYIRREPGVGDEARDRVDYQTVYARRPGAVAAPTAGLHFTGALLEHLARRGVRWESVTLHVGHGTFLPIEHDDPREHRMHAERFELGERTAALVNDTIDAGGRVVAVGTTSARVLESCVDERGRVRAARGETRLYLYPGTELRVVDVLLTNFHLPRSSLLLLVSAFAGRERVLALYREAVERRYRFFSYGDAMLLVNPRPR